MSFSCRAGASRRDTNAVSVEQIQHDLAFCADDRQRKYVIDLFFGKIELKFAIALFKQGARVIADFFNFFLMFRKFLTSGGKRGDTDNVFGARALIVFLTASANKGGKIFNNALLTVKRADTLHSADLMRRNASGITAFRNNSHIGL